MAFSDTHIYLALFIRMVEEKLLALFTKGLLFGTIHTCIGQEFSAVAFCTQLKNNDFVFSNHRCHGHYLAFSHNHEALIAEIMGRKTGVCGGIGGSQHLCGNNFFSNGVQGGIAPVAAGMALAEKIRGSNNVGVLFVGDGTLGEGVLYETLNIISKWQIPLLIVCENNMYAQSTPQSQTLAGTILGRPEAFGIKTYESSTDAPQALYDSATASIDFVRSCRQPAFHLVHTCRLMSHSKGDDTRSPEEIDKFWRRDFLAEYSRENIETVGKWKNKIDEILDRAVEKAEAAPFTSFTDYPDESLPEPEPDWQVYNPGPSGDRYAESLSKTFVEISRSRPDVVFIGEDILSPYGGAFKTMQGVSDLSPERVFPAPISEAAIIGIANGLALKGFRPITEIMFGDFITLGFDQLVNHASKFHHMYNRQVDCPVIVRTPMGGHRGYGPTHSQTLDKFLMGIDNIKVIALNNLIHPQQTYDHILVKEHLPVIIIENKTDYGRKVASISIEGYRCEATTTPHPTIRMAPARSKPDVSIITYGGCLFDAVEAIRVLFKQFELIAELIVVTQLKPLYIGHIAGAIHTRYVYTVEEGTASNGFGSEVIAGLAISGIEMIIARRITSDQAPIPCSKGAEEKVLCNRDSIIATILGDCHGGH